MKAVVISAYQPEWPAVFERIRQEVVSSFEPAAVAVEHVGSTSVPGLSAKPVIDVLLGASSLLEIEAATAALAQHGFEYVAKYEHELPMRRYFVRAAGATPRVHLHGVVLQSEFWRDHLAFRDILRRDAAVRDAYQALKLDLAARYRTDKAAYTEAKTPFIQAVLSERGQPPPA